MNESIEKFQSEVCVLSNGCLHDAYWRLEFEAPGIASAAMPGQFIHLAVPGIEGHLLRRPFSICDVNGDVMTIVYKVVGAGTNALKRVVKDTLLNVVGPLGHPFGVLPENGRKSILLGGGYGCAAMLYVAHKAVASGMTAPIVLLGARSAHDILLVEDFKHLGCEVRVSTDDGSIGTMGRITVLLEDALKQFPDAHLAACGPKPMLKAVAMTAGLYPQSTCEISLDEIMCCGVGACFGCVIKCKADTPSGWVYKRSCVEGPVFKADEVYWG